jgi:hypothetical protein
MSTTADNRIEVIASVPFTAAFVVAVLGGKYGEKRWTIFESDQFKHRIKKGLILTLLIVCKNAGIRFPEPTHWLPVATGTLLFIVILVLSPRPGH